MIIIISGAECSGKSNFARTLAESVFPQNPQVIEGIPNRKPGYLGSMTIFTHQNDTELPQWLLKRKDYTVFRITSRDEKGEVIYRLYSYTQNL